MKDFRNKLSNIKLPELKWYLRVLLYIATIIMATLSILFTIVDDINIVIASFIYVLAAVLLVLFCMYLYHDIVFGINKKLKPAIERNSFTNRVASDYHYRTVLFTYSSLAINLLYAFGNGIFGIVYRSIWFGAMSAYYIVLSIMRFTVVRYDHKYKKQISIYRRSGILLIILTLVLSAAVVQMVYADKGKHYPGTLIFAVAAYTFYKIIISVINIVKARKLKEPLLMTIRNISCADALVSLLSLQTAMFASFASEDFGLTRMMNGVTGGIVCFLIMMIGINMVGRRC